MINLIFVYCIGYVFTLVLVVYLWIGNTRYKEEGDVTLLDFFKLFLMLLMWPIIFFSILVHVSSDCVVIKGRKPKMSQGRELDLLVARDVVVIKGKEQKMNPGKELDLLIARDVMEFSVDNETKDPLPYSTDITAAFLVVNEMFRRSYDFACEQFYDVYKDDEIVYRVNFGGLNCHCGDWVRGESLPHAICKAALSAIEIEKE